MHFIVMTEEDLARQRHQMRNWFYDNEPDLDFMPGRIRFGMFSKRIIQL